MPQVKIELDKVSGMSQFNQAKAYCICFFTHPKLAQVVLMLALFCSFPVSQGFSQKDIVKSIQRDARKITPRYPSKESLEKFADDRAYQYENDPEPPANPFAKWIDLLWRRFMSLFRGKSYESFWQYVIIASAFLLVMFILYKAKVLEYIFPSKETRDVNDYVVGQENIHEMNFDHAIDDALTVADYRLAIRLQYLKTLKMLSSKELINWKPNRTNYSYVNELERYPYQKDFAQITGHFEYSWYGDFKVDQVGYQEMKAFSEGFYAKLNERSYV